MDVIFSNLSVTLDFKARENITDYTGKVKKKLTWVGEANLQ